MKPTLTPYTPALAMQWDEFVDASCNGTFLFKRRFMDYHADRFTDCSLIFTNEDKICGLLPANKKGREIESHGGLTYGGLITAGTSSAIQSIDMLGMAAEHYKGMGAERITIKPVPHIYNTQPSEAQLYALFRMNSVRTGCGLSVAVNLRAPLTMQTLRKRCAKKAEREGLTIVESNQHIDTYHSILTQTLKSCHNASPVHTAGEMKLLANRFTEETRLLTVWKNDCMIAGAWLFITPRVVHVQYIAANEEGKRLGALDLLFSGLINNPIGKQDYLDFGVCTEQNGHVLNNGLLFQKEGFGARSVVYETWQIRI